MREVSKEILEQAKSVGIERRKRAGTFFQVNHEVLLTALKEEGVELTSSTEALKKYPWLEKYWWKAVKQDKDEYTREVAKDQHHGYFIRALPGRKISLPLQACLFISKNKVRQNVHNIIIAEEGSELHIITGCASGKDVISGMHFGITEVYVKKNALLSFTMIHRWGEEFEVRPRTGVIIEEGGTYISNFVCMHGVKTLEMYPQAYCYKNAVARFNTVLVAPQNTSFDIGSKVYLEGENSRAEIISRGITKGGEIIARGCLVGKAENAKGHLECRGLILSEGGRMLAIPELEARVKGAELTHEAAVGKIAEEEISYLMARGLTKDEATSMIVRGFLNIEIEGLPEELKKEVKKAIEMAEEGN